MHVLAAASLNSALTASISFQLIHCIHRHCVFAIPEELRHFFLSDRSLLNCLFPLSGALSCTTMAFCSRASFSQPKYFAIYLCTSLAICRIIPTIRTYGTATAHLLFRRCVLLITLFADIHCILHHGQK